MSASAGASTAASVRAPRIALIHALAQSVAPIAAAFRSHWPEAHTVNLLDDSLSADLASSGRGLDDTMHERFMRLADYVVDAGAEGILFTCSAFGPCIEAVARKHSGMPVLKPNEAMIDAAVAALAQARADGETPKLGLIATFGPTLVSMPPEFPPEVVLDTELAEGALAALDAGDAAGHDQAAVAAARRLVARGCTHLALAQFSLARAALPIAQETGLQVLTTPDTAVRAIRARLGG
jgi:hypothetical protein